MSENILYFRVKDIVIFKTLTETLYNMVPEVNWIFTSKNDQDDNNFVGLEVATTDSTKTIYLRARINKTIFKNYKCNRDKHELGINLENLNKILKLVDKDDALLYFYVEENDTQNLIIKIKNKEKKNKTIYKLKLVNLNQQYRQLSKTDFDKKIEMKSDEFHKLCKEMNMFSDYMNINCSNDKIIFSCEGTCTNRTSIYQSGEDDLVITSVEDIKNKNNEEQDEINDKNIENKKNKNVIGIYEIKNIMLFNKFSNICDDFSFYMKNNFALTVIYNLSDYGLITVSFSPIKEESIKNISYTYSDDEDELDLINNGNNILED